MTDHQNTALPATAAGSKNDDASQEPLGPLPTPAPSTSAEPHERLGYWLGFGLVLVAVLLALLAGVYIGTVLLRALLGVLG